MEFELHERTDDLPVYSPVCFRCRHLDLDNIEARRCRAFPDGIPVAVWTGDHDHQTPFPGDHGVRFEKPTPEDMTMLRAQIEQEEQERSQVLARRRVARRGAA